MNVKQIANYKHTTKYIKIKNINNKYIWKSATSPPTWIGPIHHSTSLEKGRFKPPPDVATSACQITPSLPLYTSCTRPLLHSLPLSFSSSRQCRQVFGYPLFPKVVTKLSWDTPLLLGYWRLRLNYNFSGWSFWQIRMTQQIECMALMVKQVNKAGHRFSWRRSMATEIEPK